MRRRAIIATVSHAPRWSCATPDGARKLVEEAAAHIRRAVLQGADIVAFPEAYPQLAAPAPMTAHAEPLDGGTLDAARDLARRHSVHLVWPRFERDADGVLRNTSILIDRAGQVVGRYHKMFPTLGELEEGVLPGADCPAFDVDFGRVAMMICFDLNFREVRDALRAREPDVVFFSSMYRGGRQCSELALDLGAFVATAISAELGRIVDRAGAIVGVSTYEALLARSVNLNSRMVHMDYNADKVDSLLERHGAALTVEYHTQEARMVFGLESSERDVDDLLQEAGVQTIDHYFARARAARAALLTRAD